MTDSATTAIGEVARSPSYYRARYYNPTTGRFLSEDPKGFAGSGSDLYEYVGDSPTNFIDPFGLDKKKKCISDWKDSTVGEITTFLSLYSLVQAVGNAGRNPGEAVKSVLEWTALPWLKIKAIGALSSGANALGGTEILSVTGGATTFIDSSATVAIAGIETIGLELVVPTIALSTLVDMGAQAQCNYAQ